MKKARPSGAPSHSYSQSELVLLTANIITACHDFVAIGPIFIEDKSKLRVSFVLLFYPYDARRFNIHDAIVSQGETDAVARVGTYLKFLDGAVGLPSSFFFVHEISLKGFWKGLKTKDNSRKN
jgi:hypothetical protein